MNKIRLVVASLLLGAATGFAQKPFNASGTGNPIIPGYFADPTVKRVHISFPWLQMKHF